MPTKISEVKLVIGITSLILGVAILLNAKLVSTPIKVSETGILLFMLSVALIAFGIISFKTSKIKM
jgi:hypothetical protein